MKVTEIEHSSHPSHTLILKSVQEPYRCDGCKELGFGPCYQCEYEDCNFHLHEECAMASSTAVHPFFNKCDFRFHEKAPGISTRYCDACGKDVKGFSYQCLHEKAHDLHPCCLNLQHTLNGEGVTLHLRDKIPSKCLKCNSKEVFKGFKGWSYVSTCGQYCYHVACVKDLILEKWKSGFFYGQKDLIDQTQRLSLQYTVPNKELVQQSGGSSRRASKYWRIAKVVLKLIISAIFGDPTTWVAALIESLVSS